MPGAGLKRPALFFWINIIRHLERSERSCLFEIYQQAKTYYVAATRSPLATLQSG